MPPALNFHRTVYAAHIWQIGIDLKISHVD